MAQWQRLWRFLAVEEWAFQSSLDKKSRGKGEAAIKLNVSGQLSPADGEYHWNGKITQEVATPATRENDTQIQTLTLVPRPQLGDVQFYLFDDGFDLSTPDRLFKVASRGKPGYPSEGNSQEERGAIGTHGNVPRNDTTMELSGKERAENSRSEKATSALQPSKFRSYPKIQFRLRIFNPAPAAYFPAEISTAPIHLGQGRSFSWDDGDAYVRQEVTISLDPRYKLPWSDKRTSFAPTVGFMSADAGARVSGKPAWWRRPLRPTTGVPLQSNNAINGNTSIDIEWFAGIHPSVQVTLTGKVPVAKAAPLDPPISVEAQTLDWQVGVTVGYDMKRDEFWYLWGAQHDKWPAFELYLNGVPVHRWDPAKEGGSPLDLVGPPVYKSEQGKPLPPRRSWKING